MHFSWLAVTMSSTMLIRIRVVVRTQRHQNCWLQCHRVGLLTWQFRDRAPATKNVRILHNPITFAGARSRSEKTASKTMISFSLCAIVSRHHSLPSSPFLFPLCWCFLGSTPFGNYQPQKASAATFELGITRTTPSPSSASSDENTFISNHDSDSDEYLKPATDEESKRWSCEGTRGTDLLF